MEKFTSSPDQPISDGTTEDPSPMKEEELSQQPSQQVEYVAGSKLASIIVSVTLVFFLIMLDTSIIATAIPRITTEFNSLNDIGWYGAAYLLASCSLQPLTGRLYTIFDIKWTFLSFFGIFELGSLLCGVANSSDMLIIGRAVAGIGTAGLSNGALTIIAACVPLEKRPMYLGFMISTAQIGIILGPLMGGALTQYTTWRWCFYINLPPGAFVAILLFLVRLPDRGAKSDDETKSTLWSTVERLDLLGFAFFAPAAIQFLLALEWGGTRYHWNSAMIIGLFCGAAGTFVLFLVIEYRKGDEAMIPFSMLRQRIIACSCLMTLFFGGAMYVLTYYLPLWFQAVKGATPTMSGVYLLPSVLSQILFAGISGILVGKLGYYLPWAIASGILVSIANGLLSNLTPTSSTANWIGYQILGGAGRGCGLQMGIVAIQNTLPRTKIPVGMSVAIFCQTLGGALFLSFAQTTFNTGLVKTLATSAPGVDPQTVIAAGASGVRGAVTLAQLPGVLFAYNRAINHGFYLAAGASVAMFVAAWGIGWKSVKRAKAVKGDA